MAENEELFEDKDFCDDNSPFQNDTIFVNFLVGSSDVFG